MSAKSTTSGENFRPKFQHDFPRMKGKYGIGVIGYDIQPVLLASRHGVFSIVMNGNVANLDEIVAELQSQGATFAEIQPDSSISPAEVMAELISRAPNLEAGIESIFERIKGSVSLLVLTRDGIFAARDRSGHSALVVGRSETGFAVTTETTAFPNLGFAPVFELRPGEIVKLSDSGVQKIKESNNGSGHPCAFLWIYTSFPATSIEGIQCRAGPLRKRKAFGQAGRGGGFTADT